MSTIWHIYALFDESSRCFYVGQSVNPQSRSREHRKRFGASFVFAVIDSAGSARAASFIEDYYMRIFRTLGHRLVNIRKEPSPFSFMLTDEERFGSGVKMVHVPSPV